jgi:hypothetical protein
VDDALGNALTIKVGHFFEEQEIFKDYRAAWANGQGILVVAYRAACVRGHCVFLFFGHSSSSGCSLQPTRGKARARVRENTVGLLRVYFQYIDWIQKIGTAYR